MKRLTHKQIAVAAGGVGIVIAGIFAFITRPALLAYSGGLAMFDGRFGTYSLDDARELLVALGSEGINYYMFVQLPLDMIFPLAYGLALGLAIVHLQRKVPHKPGRVRAVLRSVIYAAPWLAAVIDYWENWLILRMLNAGAEGITKALVDEASRTTTYKWVFVAIAIFGLIVSALRYASSGRDRSDRGA